MKKYKILIFLSFLTSNLCAQQSFTHAKDVYISTKDEFKHISPLIAFCAIDSGLLKRIRFYGPYKKATKTIHHPHHASRTFKVDVPINGNDSIAKLLLGFFPSPDGYQLVPNKRKNDAIGNLSRQPTLINDIIKALLIYKDRFAKIWAINRILPLSAESTSVEKNNNKAVAKMIALAYEYQRISANPDKPEKQLYPENIVITTLLSYYLHCTESKEDIKKLSFLMKDTFDTQSRFTQEEYSSAKSSTAFEEELKANPETAYLIAKGFDIYERPFLDPSSFASQYDITAHDTDAPELYAHADCGETSLRNVFIIALTALNNGNISMEALDSLTSKIDPIEDISAPHTPFQKFISFFLKHQAVDRLSSGSTVRGEWTTLLSNLNQNVLRAPLAQVIYDRETGNTFSIKADDHPEITGYYNLLNVLSAIIPDRMLAATWVTDKEERLKQIPLKLNRFFELLSREGVTFTWISERTEHPELTSEFENLHVYGNGMLLYCYEMSRGHFGVRSLTSDISDWRGQYQHSLSNEWIAAMYQKSNIISEEICTPSSIFSQDIDQPHKASERIINILRHNKMAFFPLIELWMNRTQLQECSSYLESLAAEIYTYLHCTQRNSILEDVYERIIDPRLNEEVCKHSFSTALRNKNLIVAAHFLSKLTQETILNMKHELDAIIKQDSVEILDVFIQSGINVNEALGYLTTPLVQFAIRNNKKAVAKYLLTQGARWDLPTTNTYEKETAVDLIVRQGDKDLFELVCSYGLPLDYKNHNNESLLQMALEGNDIEFVKYLMNIGLDINEIDAKGNTLLHLVANSAKLDTLDFLISYIGHFFELQNADGETPFLSICNNGYSNLITLSRLLEKGALMTVKNKDGYTGLHLATKSDDSQLVEFLLSQENILPFFMENWIIPNGKTASDLVDENNDQLFEILENAREKWFISKDERYSKNFRNSCGNSDSDDY